jgi:hypothetical protein
MSDRKIVQTDSVELRKIRTVERHGSVTDCRMRRAGRDALDEMIATVGRTRCGRLDGAVGDPRAVARRLFWNDGVLVWARKSAGIDGWR